MVLAVLGSHTEISAGTPQMLLSHIEARNLELFVYFDKQRHCNFPDVLLIVEGGINRRRKLVVVLKRRRLFGLFLEGNGRCDNGR